MKKGILILFIFIITVSLIADSIPIKDPDNITIQGPDSIPIPETDSITTILEDDFTRGMREGEKYANGQSEIKWGFIGFASGFLLAPLGIGCLGATVSGYLAKPSIPKAITFKNSGFIMGFKNTYTSRIKRKRVFNSLIGGTVGSLSLGILLWILNNTVWL